MKLLMHDLNPQDFLSLGLEQNAETIIVSDRGDIRPCIGCFGCWIKTPGMCVLKDSYQNMGKLLSTCHEVVIISQCIYGCYSPFIRNALDRSISYILPYFVTKNGETHHQNRYDNHFIFTVHFYGDDIAGVEQRTAKALVAANTVNMHSTGHSVYFHNNLQSIKEILS